MVSARSPKRFLSSSAMFKSSWLSSSAMFKSSWLRPSSSFNGSSYHSSTPDGSLIGSSPSPVPRPLLTTLDSLKASSARLVAA